MAPLDRSHMSSSRSIATMTLSCITFEIKRLDSNLTTALYKSFTYLLTYLLSKIAIFYTQPALDARVEGSP